MNASDPAPTSDHASRPDVVDEVVATATAPGRTPNPPDFVTAVAAHLEHARGQFNYDQMRFTFLNTNRFYDWGFVLASQHVLEGQDVLSSGCGFGGSLLAYNDFGARTITGVEVDPEYVALAQLRVADLDHAEVHLVEDVDLPFGDDSFDVVESTDVIEHVSDPARYLRELHRVLRSDGLVLLSTPNRVWPVEQHLGIAGPPWLPVPLADALFGALARLPFLSDERRFKYRKLRGMRTQNLSLRRLQRLAKREGFFLRVLRPQDHPEHWPLPDEPSWVRRLADHPVGRQLAPTKTLVCTLTPTRTA